MDLNRAEEGSRNSLQLVRSEVIYWCVDVRDSNCRVDYLYKRACCFEHCAFQSPIPLPVGAINVGIVEGSFDDLISLKLHSNGWLHEKARTYLKNRRHVE